jgi:hypothetical protein
MSFVSRASAAFARVNHAGSPVPCDPSVLWRDCFVSSGTLLPLQHGLQERPRAIATRTGEDILGRSFLGDAAVLEEQDPVGDFAGKTHLLATPAVIRLLDSLG